MWKLIPLQYQILIEFAGMAAIAIALSFVHHHIYQQGYDDAMAKTAAASAQRTEQAHQDIVKIGGKYEKIRTRLHRQNNYNGPVSPLVGAAIDSLRGNSAAAASGQGKRMSAAHPAAKNHFP